MTLFTYIVIIYGLNQRSIMIYRKKKYYFGSMIGIIVLELLLLILFFAYYYAGAIGSINNGDFPPGYDGNYNNFIFKMYGMLILELANVLMTCLICIFFLFYVNKTFYIFIFAFNVGGGRAR